mgnify:CR=1 FL=1
MNQHMSNADLLTEVNMANTENSASGDRAIR